MANSVRLLAIQQRMEALPSKALCPSVSSIGIKTKYQKILTQKKAGKEDLRKKTDETNRKQIAKTQIKSNHVDIFIKSK